MLVIIAGSSGSGKNTIIKEVLKQNPSYKFMPSITTREMRDGEQEGDPYFFVSESEFDRKIVSGEMMEWVEVHKGTFYGISNEVYRKMSKVYPVLIKDIDVDGVNNAKRAGVDVVSIFINVADKDALRQRLIIRGTTPEDIERRMSRYDYEKEKSKTMDYIVENNTELDLPIAISRVNDIIKQELEKRK